ncbi:MAG TPA: hypothetical protein VF155_07960 [Candidatus Dormibacteraeota bacterium]
MKPAPTPAKTVAFWLTVPPGWSDATSNASVIAAVRPDGNLLMLLRGPEPTPAVRGVSDVTPIVVVTELRQPLAASQVDTYLQSVKAAGASDISTPMPTTVSGGAATAITYQSTLDGTAVQTKDVVVAHGGAMYEIELITSRSQFSAQSQLFDQLLSRDWAWVTAD